MAKAPWRFDVRSSLLTLAVAALGLGGYRALRPKPPHRPTLDERVAADLHRIDRLKVGQAGRLINPTGRSVAVGLTRADYDAVAQAEDEGDDMGVQTLVASDRALRVPSNSEGTLQEKAPLGLVKLKFTGGDFTGITAWTSGEYFH